MYPSRAAHGSHEELCRPRFERRGRLIAQQVERAR